ncbi:HepT-like ribonuclease domain-containing protein [Microcoleus sp. B4-D4]|uniref:HepT-like ribonuclease domain-containing protein n=1 Tax=Microcoleus sp. B4-D4 TaxID=2818667 RepID=UPI003FA598B9
MELITHPIISCKAVVERRGFRPRGLDEYFRVSLNLVWAIVQNNLPPLKVTVEQILQELLDT